MPRPKQKKHVCCKRKGLLIRSTSDENEVLTLSLEAFEAFRLIDYERMTQLEASKTMGVARTTIQGLYQEARKIIAKSLVEDKMVKIKGGDHLMHEEKKCCHQHDKVEKVAVVLNEQRGIEAYHQARQFLLCTVEEGKLIRQDLIQPEGEEKQLCRRFMLSLGVNSIITSSMSKNTFEKYQNCDIKVYYSASSLDMTISNYSNKKLQSIENHLVDLEEECHQHAHEHKDHGCCHGAK